MVRRSLDALFGRPPEWGFALIVTMLAVVLEAHALVAIVAVCAFIVARGLARRRGLLRWRTDPTERLLHTGTANVIVTAAVLYAITLDLEIAAAALLLGFAIVEAARASSQSLATT